MYKKILLIGHSNIGDVACNLAVVEPLRRAFPHAAISFLTSSRAKNIVEGYQGISEIMTFDKHTRDKGIGGRLHLITSLIKKRFDLAVVLKRSDIYHFLFIPQVWSVQRFLKGKKLSDTKKHAIDVYLEFLRSHGVAATEPVFNFSVSKEDEEFCRRFLNQAGVQDNERLIGILPMAAWALKNWPIAYWNQLAQQVKPLGIRVIAFGANDRTIYGQRVLKEISPEIISAIDKTTLKQAMALIRRCQIFLGPDSSLLHLASFMRVETIGLYGPTNTDFIYPYFHRDNITIVQEKPYCMPCYPGPEDRPCKDPDRPGACMEHLSVVEVLKVVREKLRV